MSGKRPYGGSIYTLPLTGLGYAATQVERWTRNIRGRMPRRRRPTGFPGRRGPARGRRPMNRRRRRRPTRTGTRMKKKFHQSATLSGDGSFSVMASECFLSTAVRCIKLHIKIVTLKTDQRE